MRMIRGLIMILAVLSMVGNPAVAMTAIHGQAQAVSAGSTHHHDHYPAADHQHAVDEAHDDATVVEADLKNGALGHEHHCPFHHDGGKCCDGVCCLSNCIIAAFDSRLGADVAFRVTELGLPAGDLRSDATDPCLPDRPPITT